MAMILATTNYAWSHNFCHEQLLSSTQLLKETSLPLSGFSSAFS